MNASFVTDWSLSVNFVGFDTDTKEAYNSQAEWPGVVALANNLN